MTHAPRARRKLRGEWHHPLDVILLDLAERVDNAHTRAAMLHLMDCAGCRCHYGRLRAEVRG
jgi:hypothetical protein